MGRASRAEPPFLDAMKTESQQAMQLDTAAVWADEAPKVSPQRGLAAVRWIVALAVLVTALGVGGSIWIYLSGIQSLRAQAAQVVDSVPKGTHEKLSRLIKQTDLLALETATASAAGGVAILLVIVLGGRLWQRGSMAQVAKLNEESGQRILRLQVQVTELRLAEEEAGKGKSELEKRMGSLSQSHAALQNEVNQRKQSEKSLAQERQQLERSKDVLEMHVQVRTQELQKLQRRNELILNSAGEGICGFDLQGKATFVNPAAARITGWKIEEMIGKSEEEIFYPVKARDVSKGPWLLRDEKGKLLPEQIFYRKEGISFPVEYVQTAISENEKVVGAVVMFKDITERKMAEDKLAHKAAELARSNAELEQFAFVASHDMQEPLRKIQAFGDRLKIKCEAVQLEEGRDYLDRMQSAAARMQTLINDLLTFSRVISASQPFVPVDLGAVTQEVLVDLEVRLEKNNAQITVGQLPTIDADPTQMRQLLQNLIGNALKFQAPGAVPTVKVEAQMITRDQIQEGTVFPKPPPTASPDDKFCVLTVQDNGIGFEEEYLEKIFAVFQRLHGRSEYEGTGVGLAVCRRITDRHGGLITAQSKLGEGSIFIVILPMQQRKVETPK
ncbi:MAG: Multi-sensor signal transduction histidine kinase [Pedosphaera sp.]|nr:Multi-sensor signal transduction histidine kinase [Pedosphaera sp.]